MDVKFLLMIGGIILGFSTGYYLSKFVSFPVQKLGVVVIIVLVIGVISYLLLKKNPNK